MSDNQNIPPTQYQSSDGILSSMPPTATATQRSQPPPRWVTGIAPGALQGGWGTYTGFNLVGLSNRIEREPYEITDEYVRTQYADIRAEDRAGVFLDLEKYGLLPGDPNNYENQLRGLANLLDYANTMGVTAARALEELKKGAPVRAGGGGGIRRYRVSSPEDLKVVAKRVAQETIGRAFTDEEANQFVSAYQQREVQSQQQYYAGGVSTEAPSPDVFAQGFAQQVAPTEANGYKFLGYMNQLFQAAGGR